MIKREKTIFGFTDIINENIKLSSKSQLTGFVDVNDFSNIKPSIELYINGKTINELSNNEKEDLKSIYNINGLSDFELYQKLSETKLLPIKGIIKNDNLIVKGVTVSFIDQNNITKDYCITNNDGEYRIYVEPGLYTIKIGNNSFPNREVEQGKCLAYEYYYVVDGLISQREHDNIEYSYEGGDIDEGDDNVDDTIRINKDSIRILGTNKRMIHGRLVDRNHEPVLNSEIIITNSKSDENEVVAYIKPDKDGKYFFSLENGNYDIRLRSRRRAVQIIRNIDFNEDTGFVEAIKNVDKSFGKGNWVMIGGE